MIISVFPKKHSKILSRRLKTKLCVRIQQCVKQSLRDKNWFGTVNRLHYTFRPSRVEFSGTRTNFTRARTTYPAGPSTGEILARHGWDKVVYITNFIRTEPLFLVRVPFLSEPCQIFCIKYISLPLSLLALFATRFALFVFKLVSFYTQHFKPTLLYQKEYSPVIKSHFVNKKYVYISQLLFPNKFLSLLCYSHRIYSLPSLILPRSISDQRI